MDILLIIIGAALIITGIIGSFLPVLPGLPFSYAGLLILQLTSFTPFTTMFLVYWAIIIIVVMSLESILPAVGSERMGGTRYGIWGCIIGAFIGELISGQKSDMALRAAIGSFIGFFVGTVIKVAVSFVLAFHFIRAVI